MWHDVAAELAKASKRPANWMLILVAVALTVAFGYLVPYAAYTGGTTAQVERTFSSMLPGNFHTVAVSATPVFVGALALILGVLVVGSEYHWETWKTVLTQRSGRISVFTAKLLVLILAAAALVLVLFLVSAGASLIIATLESQDIEWPAADDAAIAFGAGVLISGMWTFLGAALAVALRSVALPIGLGLVWMLAIQNLLTAIAAPMIDWIADLHKGLPGPNAGSLAASLGAAEAAPGIDEIVDPTQAVTVLAIYLCAFAAAGGVLFKWRNIT